MTLSEIRNEIRQQIGEPTDLTPIGADADVQYNGGPLLTWTANEGQRQIAAWKDPETQKVYRHPQLYAEMFFQTKVFSGTLPDQTGLQADEILLTAAFGPEDGRYVNWLVTVGSEVKRIMVYNGGARLGTVDSDWASTPALGAAFTLTTRVYLMVDPTHAWASENISIPAPSDRYRSEGNLIEVLKIEDVSSLRELTKASRVESFLGTSVASGSPSSYYRIGNRIYFDQASSEELWLRLEYYRSPTDMVALADEPELSEQFHYAIVLWGIWWGFRRAGDNAGAYNVSQELRALMKRIVAHSDIKDDRKQDYGVLRRG